MAESNIYIRGFNGINNILNPKKLKTDDLVDAVNVDITNENTIKSRPSWKKIKELNKPHSLYSSVQSMFLIEGNYLIKYDKNLKKEIIDDGYLNLKTSFVKYNNQVIISNENFIKKYKNNKIYNLVPEKYINNFNVNIQSNGNFPKGRYKIAITYVFDDGLEGSTNNPVVVELNDNETIRLSNFNKTNDINIKYLRVYISKTNSIEMYRYADYDVDINEITLNYNQIEFGKRLEKIDLDIINKGKFITTFNGLILTAIENRIYISLPNSFFIDYDKYSGFLEFNSNITMLQSIDGVNGGIYVSDEDNVYFLNGDINSLSRTIMDCQPAIINTACKSPITNELFFYTQRGQIIAQPGGKIENLTESRFLPDYELLSGAGIVVLHDGRRKIINSIIKGNPSSAGFGDWAKIID